MVVGVGCKNFVVEFYYCEDWWMLFGIRVGVEYFIIVFERLGCEVREWILKC